MLGVGPLSSGAPVPSMCASCVDSAERQGRRLAAAYFAGMSDPSPDTRDRPFDIAVWVVLVTILLICAGAAVFLFGGMDAYSNLPPR